MHARTSALPGLNHRLLAALVLVLSLVLASIGCAPERGISPRVDPGTIRFSPTHTRAELAIRNPGPLARPLRDLRMGGDDWDALRFVDDELPRVLPAHGVAIVRLELSPSKFLDGRGNHREGHATLEFESEGESIVVPIVFEPEPRPRGALPFALGLTALLTLAAGLTAALRRPTVAERSQQVAGALACVGLLASATTLPLASAWCGDRLGDAVGPLELAQCRAGLGGHALAGWVVDPTLAWLLALLTVATLGLVLLERRAAASLVARLLGFGLIVAALVACQARGELEGLVMAQQQSLTIGELALPRWGLLVQPLGFVLALLLIADAGPHERPLGRLDDLVWAYLVTLLFLGGGSLPGLTTRPLPYFVHGFELALALLVTAIEVGLVKLAIRGLRARRLPRTRPTAARERLRTARQSRTLTTLALANLLVTVSVLALLRFFG